MWFEEQIKHGDLKKYSIRYHKAIKSLAGMHVWESNHAVCEKLMSTFLNIYWINDYWSIIPM